MMYGTWQRRKGTLGSYAINKKNIAKSNGEVNFLNNNKKKKKIVALEVNFVRGK